MIGKFQPTVSFSPAPARVSGPQVVRQPAPKGTVDVAYVGRRVAALPPREEKKVEPRKPKRTTGGRGVITTAQAKATMRSLLAHSDIFH